MRSGGNANKLLGSFFAAPPLGLLKALILSLRIADGFSEHLAQLSLGLCRFPLGWLPLGHEQYVGMLEEELNPARTACLSAFARIADSSLTSRYVQVVPNAEVAHPIRSSRRRAHEALAGL